MKPSAIEIRDLHHEYDGVVALGSVSLDVHTGEFLTLLGPSGSGKSTLLHILAGLIDPTSGVIRIDSKDVTRTPPQKREIGLVFQNYALFPHMTAEQNIRFPLGLRRQVGMDPDARVAEVLELVHLSALAGRRPEQLSGGQQQRVAVGRAISGAPKVLLLDEPLGALDRKLRQQLGREIRRVQQETSITTVYVTHDQEEAFTMSDRVVVMDGGEIRQVGTPEEIYDAPRDTFVAGFVGEVNFVPVKVESVAGGVATTLTPTGVPLQARSVDRDPGDAAMVVRPERVALWDLGQQPAATVQNATRGTVSSSTFLGNSRHVLVDTELGSIQVLEFGDATPRARGDRVEVGWRATDARVIEDVGDRVRLTSPV